MAIVFALSWPALIRSVDAKRWSAALIALVAMLLSGAYSVTAALGSASGGRANAAASETATADARSKAQAAYDTAKAELDALTTAKPAEKIQALIDATRTELAKMPPARSVAEVEAVLAGAKPQCRIVVTMDRRDTVCAPPASLTAEFARARQRERLTAKVASLVDDAGKAEERPQVRQAGDAALRDRSAAW